MLHKKRKLEDAQEDGWVERTCPLDHYALSFILDFTGNTFFALFVQPSFSSCEEPSGMDHPFRKVCKATREAWLDHPFSLPLRIKMELASKLPTHARTHEQRISLLQILQESLGVLAKEVEREQRRRDQEKEKKKLEEWRQECIAAMIESLQQSSILG